MTTPPRAPISHERLRSDRPRHGTRVGMGYSVASRLELEARNVEGADDQFLDLEIEDLSWAPGDSGVLPLDASFDDPIEEDDDCVIPLTRARSSWPPPNDPLPEWVPESRIMGGYYLLRAIGDGGTSNVFVAIRSEDQGVLDAPRFALKVPDFESIAPKRVNATVASQLFREELAVLAILPPHPNLGRLVAFDASGPKPFIVMELVEGIDCEAILAMPDLTMDRVLSILDTVLSALEAMHELGIGHLDLKPANVVLRRGEEPVLVDFGLAGGRIRPSFLTGPYAAPEVWSTADARAASPPRADIYSFGCLAYEMLTGNVLFEAPSTVALILAHANHDGTPPRVAELAREAPDVAEFLRKCLRHDPSDRATASELREELVALREARSRCKWPLSANS